MGRVLDVIVNNIGEVTDALILKGNGESVKRHVKSLILLLKSSESEEKLPSDKKTASKPRIRSRLRPKRKAAEKCLRFINTLSDQSLV